MSTSFAPEREAGRLSINAENVLPIIKKWLYSDKEIFLRELLSNSVDALTKLKHLALSEGLTVPLPEIAVRINKSAGEIRVSDTGIGMSAEEILKYIAQVAFSGAEDFLSRYKMGNESDYIIGHFGLGFYSVFMVADRVEIVSKSYRTEVSAVSWISEGGLDYTLGPATREAIGTDITLHLCAEDSEFLDDARLERVIKKYCNYLPVPISLNGRIVNQQVPIWTKIATSLKDSDYLEFFRKTYISDEDPLFWIHLNADYPFRLQGVLYFPKFKHEFDAAKGEVQLYCNQVFVSENTQDLIPRFLTVLRGIIDCPDIPLNVSRSSLQNDPYVRKISAHITKKVADKLVLMFKTTRETFDKLWEHLHPFVKFGMMEDNKFFQACREILLYESTSGGYTTLDDYLARNREKHSNHVYYATAADQQATYLQLVKSEGMEALILPSLLDMHFIHFLESKQDVRWSRVDSAVSDNLIDKSESKRVVDAQGRTLDDRVKERFESSLGKVLDIKVNRLKSSEIPAVLIEPEYARRLKDMSVAFGREVQMPGRKTLVVNSSSPLVVRISQAETEEVSADLCAHLYDLARLAHEGLKGEDLTRFIARSQKLLLR